MWRGQTLAGGPGRFHMSMMMLLATINWCWSSIVSRNEWVSKWTGDPELRLLGTECQLLFVYVTHLHIKANFTPDLPG